LTSLFNNLPRKKKFLEIGSFEGRSTCWFLSQLDPDGMIVCIDTWAGSEEHAGMDLNGLYERFSKNVEEARGKLQKIVPIKGKSEDCLNTLNMTFDMVYVDGSHQAPDVLTDACMAFPMLNKGGVMVFDDYLWGKELGTLHNPKIAVDAFVNIFAEKCQLVGIGYQLAIQKIVD
jgi:predicted O-methyltransferase YrrM